MSRRVLYWNHDMLLWECLECQRHELGYRKGEKEQPETSPAIKWAWQLSLGHGEERDTITGRMDTMDVYCAWQDTVED